MCSAICLHPILNLESDDEHKNHDLFELFKYIFVISLLFSSGKWTGIDL